MESPKRKTERRAEAAWDKIGEMYGRIPEKDTRTSAEIRKDNKLIKRKWVRASILEEYVNKPQSTEEELEKMVDGVVEKDDENK